MATSICDIVGDGVLMYQSDYPHNQAEFPHSPDVVLGVVGPRRGTDDARS